MAETSVQLQPGFVVEDGWNRVPSESFSLPNKIARIVTLFQESGILDQENAYLKVSTTPARRGAPSRSILSVQITSDQQYAEIRPFAGQAVLVTLLGRRYEDFEHVRLVLDAELKKIPRKMKLSPVARGKYHLLQNFFEENNVSQEDVIRLVNSGIPIEKLLVSLRDGIDVESILLLNQLPDSYWGKLMQPED